MTPGRSHVPWHPFPTLTLTQASALPTPSKHFSAPQTRYVPSFPRIHLRGGLTVPIAMPQTRAEEKIKGRKKVTLAEAEPAETPRTSAVINGFHCRSDVAEIPARPLFDARQQHASTQRIQSSHGSSRPTGEALSLLMRSLRTAYLVCYIQDDAETGLEPDTSTR